MVSKFTAQYLPKANAPTKPIRVGRNQSQARISIAEAKELQQQLSVSIRQAEHNLIVTPPPRQCAGESPSKRH